MEPTAQTRAAQSPRYLPASPEGALRERLARVRYIFTDIDGTLFAPGSCALSDNDRAPSLTLATALVDLKRAGIEVIPCSGRCRAMLHEDCRVLGFNSYIGDMGGLIMYDLKADDWEYFAGDMPYDPACGLTPHQVIERTGAIQRIIDRYPGHIEYYNDMANGYKYREVAFGLRGDVPEGELRAMLEESGAEVDLANNGRLNYVSKPTTLELAPGTSAWGYMVVPRGLNKGVALDRFCARKGIDRLEALGIGDSSSDFELAPHVGTFVCVENALANAEVCSIIHQCGNAYVALGSTIDGWAYMASALLAARE